MGRSRQGTGRERDRMCVMGLFKVHGWSASGFPAKPDWLVQTKRNRALISSAACPISGAHKGKALGGGVRVYHKGFGGSHIGNLDFLVPLQAAIWAMFLHVELMSV